MAAPAGPHRPATLRRAAVAVAVGLIAIAFPVAALAQPPPQPEVASAQPGPKPSPQPRPSAPPTARPSPPPTTAPQNVVPPPPPPPAPVSHAASAVVLGCRGSSSVAVWCPAVSAGRSLRLRSPSELSKSSPYLPGRGSTATSRGSSRRLTKVSGPSCHCRSRCPRLTWHRRL